MHGGAWDVSVRPPAALLPHAVAGPAGLLALVLLLTLLTTFLASKWVSRPGGRLLACGLGGLAGTIFLLGVTIPPRRPADDLPALLVIGLALAWLMTVPRLARARLPMLAAFALAAGWWLAGAPGGLEALGHAALRLPLTAGWLFLLSWLLVEADAWTLVAAAFALFAALHAAGAPAVWPLLAVIPAAACGIAPIRAPVPAPLPAVTPRRKRSGPGRRGRAGRREAARPPAVPPVPPRPRLLLPAALALALFAAAAASGQAHRPPGPADAACLAPVAAAWLMARFRPRLRWLGPAGGAAKAASAVAVVAVIAFSAAALAGLR